MQATFKRTAAVASVTAAMLLAVTSQLTGNAAASRASDERLAKQAALSLSDFPAGWRASSSSDSSDLEKVARGIAACRSYLKLRTLATTKVPRSGTHDFAMGEDSTVSNGVIVLPTPKAANAAYALFADSSVPACLQKVVTRTLSQSTTSSRANGNNVAVAHLSVDTIGDRTTAYQTVIQVGAGGVTQSLALDTQLVQVDRSLSLFTCRDVDDTLRSTLLRAVAGRLEAGASATTTTR